MEPDTRMRTYLVGLHELLCDAPGAQTFRPNEWAQILAMNKKNAEIYRKAAKLIEDGSKHYCCHAIAKASGKKRGFKSFPDVKAFDRLFSESGNYPSYTISYLLLNMTPKEARNVRVLMLLLMAAMEEE